MAYCSTCGAALAEDARFCTKCGAAVQTGDPDAAILPSFPTDHAERPAPRDAAIAGYWWRALGYVIDGVILAIVNAVVVRGFSLSTVAANVVGAIVVFCYATGLIWLNGGRTLGMMACRLRCVRATDQGPVGAGPAALRAAVAGVFLALRDLHPVHIYKHPDAHQKVLEAHSELIVLALLIPLLVDLLWPAWDGRRQALHDKAAGTVVVRQGA